MRSKTLAEVREMKKLVIDVPKCGHCGKPHPALEFFQLEEPERSDVSHVAVCPETRQCVYCSPEELLTRGGK